MPWTPRQASYMRINKPAIFKREVNKLGSALIKRPTIRTGYGGKKDK